MTVAKLLPVRKFDLGSKMEPWERRRADGKELRRKAPLESHALYKPSKSRPDPLNQAEEDHARLLTAIKRGDIKADIQSDDGS